MNEKNDTLEQTGEWTSITRNYRHDIQFMNDRMKGLDKSLEQTFPNHHLNDCVQHMKANVQQRFGMKAASFVVSIVRSFSTRQEEFLLEKL